MTMTAFHSLNQIINCVRSSNLNFAYQETPFSLYLTIRKTNVKNQQANSSQSTPVKSQNDVEALEKENLVLKNTIHELEDKLNTSEDNTKVLEEKVAGAEAEVLKVFDQTKKGKETLAKKDDEIKCLKNVIKSNNSTIAKLETNKNELNKTLKQKEKELHDSEKRNQACQDTIKVSKNEAKKHKDEKKELSKTNDQFEKKVKRLEMELKKVTNNNTLSKPESEFSVSTTSCTSLCCSTAIKCLICGKLCSGPNDLKMHSETHHDLSIDFEKLADPDEEDSTSRYINSLIFDPAFLDKWKNCFPEHWDHINERIKVRIIAKMNFADKSAIIDRNMKQMDLSKVIYHGRCYDTSLL